MPADILAVPVTLSVEEDDIDLLRRIRELLYSDGYTIKGVQKLLRAWLAKTELPGAVRVQVDVDPYSFL